MGVASRKGTGRANLTWGKEPHETFSVRTLYLHGMPTDRTQAGIRNGRQFYIERECGWWGGGHLAYFSSESVVSYDVSRLNEKQYGGG